MPAPLPTSVAFLLSRRQIAAAAVGEQLELITRIDRALAADAGDFTPEQAHRVSVAVNESDEKLLDGIVRLCGQGPGDFSTVLDFLERCRDEAHQSAEVARG